MPPRSSSSAASRSSAARRAPGPSSSRQPRTPTLRAPAPAPPRLDRASHLERGARGAPPVRGRTSLWRRACPYDPLPSAARVEAADGRAVEGPATILREEIGVIVSPRRGRGGRRVPCGRGTTARQGPARLDPVEAPALAGRGVGVDGELDHRLETAAGRVATESTTSPSSARASAMAPSERGRGRRPDRWGSSGFPRVAVLHEDSRRLGSGRGLFAGARSSSVARSASARLRLRIPPSTASDSRRAATRPPSGAALGRRGVSPTREDHVIEADLPQPPLSVDRAQAATGRGAR